MRILADTHLLLWAAADPRRLPSRARDLLGDPANEVRFSAASIWEVAIKSALVERPDFEVDAAALADGLRSHDWRELPVSAAHAARVAVLPSLHRDPFDRILVAQAHVERLTLVTHDAVIAGYPGSIELV